MTTAITTRPNAPLPEEASAETPVHGRLLPGGCTVQASESGAARMDAGPGGLKPIGGSDYPAFNEVLLARVVATIAPFADAGPVQDRVAAAATALAAFEPTDEVEGMLAAQAVALHHAAMECLRRAMLNQSPEVAARLRKDGANLARAMTDMLDALARKRGKGPQIVRVERVVVQQGGQAVVGNVQAGGGV